MTFRPDVVRGAPSGAPTGVVDFRLPRNGVVKAYKQGRLTRLDVCDAHPELIRAAKNVGTESTVTCPICEATNLRLVTYVFGARLPAHGRCVSTATEMATHDRRREAASAYVDEACIECHWHHLRRVVPIGGR